MKATILLRACLPGVFWFGVVLLTVLTLMPSSALPQALSFWDKAQHAVAFAALALTGALAFPLRVKPVAIGLIAYGGLIEIMQSAFTTTRTGDPLDWLADAIGVIVGFLLYGVLVACSKAG